MTNMPLKLEVKVRLVGNSLTVTLPHPITKTLNIKKGDVLLISLDNSKITIEKP